MLEETGTPAESPLPPAILRGLGDRSYEKRKTAALDVTAMIKSLQEAGERDCIANVVNLLAHEFTRSRNVHHRKGGLIGLAACAIGLVPDIERFLHLLIPPVLECFDDPESRVCYYACESLYNISKVARSSILKFFNVIFDGLCKLFAHVDVDVKNGANLLDRLIKDIVTESDTFDVEGFIPLLSKQIKRTKPYIRQLIVGWILVLNAVPDINMLDYLPEFLDGLFNMLSDCNVEIQQAAHNALQDFLKEIEHAEVVEFGSMVNILVAQCKSLERSHRLAALHWVAAFINLGKTRLVLFYTVILSSVMYNVSDQEMEISNAAKTTNQGLLQLVKSTNENFELGSLLQILITELQSEHVTTRVASLEWIGMAHEKDPIAMDKYILTLLPALLRTISDTDDEVVLLSLQVLASISFYKKQFLRVLNSLVSLFEEDRSLLETRGALVIRKLCVLLDSRSIYLSLSDILSNLTQLDFVSQMVQTLNLLLLTAPELISLRKSLKNCFDGSSGYIGKKTLNLEHGKTNNNYDSDKSNYLEIKNDCNKHNENDIKDRSNDIDINKSILADNSEKESLSVMADEKEEVGVGVGVDVEQYYSDVDVFTSLFNCWCHNPVATFSLCLLSQAYDLSAQLILRFADVDVTVGFLMQVDKLVQLLESPIFIHLRLQLLEVTAARHYDLLKSLYGLLMLLPQSLAYRTLSDRLMTVSSLQMHIGFSENRNNNHHNHNNDNSNGNCDNDIASLNNNQSTSNNNKFISKINTSIENNINNSRINNHISSNYNNNGNNTGNTGSHTQHTVNASRLSGYYDGLLLRFETVQEKHVTFKLTSLSHKKYKPSNFGSVTKAEDPGDLGSASGIANSEEI